MKKTVRLIVLAAALAFGPQLEAGVVLVQTVESEGQTGRILLTIDGNKARIDLSPAVSILIDGESGRQVTLMHLMKQTLTLTPKEGERLGQAVEGGIGKGKTRQGPRLVATGRKATVGKHAVEIHTFEAGKLNATYWIATDYPQPEILLEAMKVLEMGATAAVTASTLPGAGDLPGFPVKTETVLNGRKIVNTLESATLGPIDARVFEIPRDYVAAEKLPLTREDEAPAPRGP